MPEQVQQIASHAEQHDHRIVDKMSVFYAEHTTLVKTLGGAQQRAAVGRMSVALSAIG